MRRWVLGFFCAIVLPCSVQGFAQQAVPRTLEALAQTVEAEKAPAAPEAEPKDAGPKRPAGTLVRPKDGVKHPDLDRAWADYDAAVAIAAENIMAAISRQFDAATSKGDLDAAEKWQAAQEKFQRTGELPEDATTKTVISTAISECRKATEVLSSAYDSAVKNLTVAKSLTEARAAKSEQEAICKRSAGKERQGAVLIPKGRFQAPGDPLVRVVEPNGRFYEILRDSGRTHAYGLWREMESNAYEAQLNNGWTIFFGRLTAIVSNYARETHKGKCTLLSGLVETNV